MLWNGASDLINSFHVVCTSNNGQTTEDLINDLAEAIDDLYGVIVAFQSNNGTFADINLSNYSAGEVYGSQPWPTRTVGSNGNNAINPALGVFAYTPTTIPNVQGRKWWGPFGEDVNEDGIWSTALVAACDALQVALQSDLTSSIGAVWTPTIAHLKEVVDGEVVDAETPEFRTYGPSIVSANAGVLTRRRPGSGS
jgi:hypothetical protein